MALSKKKKQGWLITALVAVAGVIWFILNPNMKTWKNEVGLTMVGYSLIWSPFNSTITVAGRSDLSGVKSGNKITWNNGSVWTS